MDNKETEDQTTTSFLIGLEKPVNDYTRLIKEKVENVDELIEEEIRSQNFDKIASAMQATIWKLLFDDENNEENHKKAEEALKTYRTDACFYNPWNYNEWMPLVRDELQKRKMSNFWKNVICKYELGLCWARDCDYFDDIDDPTPMEFYNFDFDNENKTNPTKVNVTKSLPQANSILTSSDAHVDMQKYLDIYAPCFGHHNSPTTKDEIDNIPILIGIDDPLTDYKNLIDRKVETAKDDDQMSSNFNEIAKETRECIWKLLFETNQNDSIIFEKNMKKAEDLLEIYKRDACFHNPWDYNEWIPLVRDELLKRKMFTFWKDVIVAQKLGLCWARDSDLFDDLEDPKPMEFYNATCTDILLSSKPKK